MSLSPEQRARYARHTLLPEIGLPGQERLCASRVMLDGEPDPEAAAVAADYLERAGLRVVEMGSPDAFVAPLAALARSTETRAPGLVHAAAALAGAYAAVEAIKRVTGAGTPGVLPDDFELGLEE